MSNNLSVRGDEFTIWVVVKQNLNNTPCELQVEEQGYFDERNANNRVEHIKKWDGRESSWQQGYDAWAFPVRFYWPFKPPSDSGAAAPVNPTPLGPPIAPLGPVTFAAGQELNAYHVPWLGQQPRLSQIVGDAWLSWRHQQANVGNWHEAGQDGPSAQTLQSLYQEEPTQLELSFSKPIEDVPAPLH